MESTSTPIAAWLSDTSYWAFLGIFLINITQRRHQKHCPKKRYATLYVGLGAFVVFLISQGIVIYRGADWMLVPGIAAVAGTLYYYRAHTWPFRFNSPSDGRRLSFKEFMYDDNHGDPPY